MTHDEQHKTHRTGWLRAAVLGANDGIVSTASLLIGVAAAGASQENILLAGIAGLVAGAMSMAAGEYVSVSSQADAENADLALERWSLENHHERETEELAGIYRERGLDARLAQEVAEQLMAHDALGAHARDDIGISEVTSARPAQAALYSGLMFTVGALLPLLVTLVFAGPKLILAIAISSIVFLGTLGAVAAHTGGASKLKGASRVMFWGALAMALTAAVGWLFDVVV